MWRETENVILFKFKFYPKKKFLLHLIFCCIQNYTSFFVN